MQPLRLALLGAFAFPAPLGSQRFFAEQARALAAAGAEVELFTYETAGARLRGLDPRKLAADRALGRRLAAAQRTRPFDAVLAHNAEAALVALAQRGRLGLPVVYVAHTLWAEELLAWAPGPAALARRAGRALDRAIAHAADGVLALTETAERALAPAARGPVVLVPPGHRPEPAPATEEVARACARHDLSPEGYALYAGNLDPYQELGALDAAAAHGPGLPLVAVTHDVRGARFGRLRVIEVETAAEASLLTRGAAVALLPRRAAGGFPIKLLHYMEAGRALVARADVGAALTHDESAWLLRADAGPSEFAGAIRTLAADAARRRRLGEGARRMLAERFAWPERAAETLALVRAALERPAGR